MFNNRGDRKRELSIYSILTKVIKKISWEMSGKYKIEEKVPISYKEAGLLVNATYIRIRKRDESNGEWSKEYIDEIRREGYLGYTPHFTEKDGERWEKFPGHRGILGVYPQALIFSPGYHTFAFNLFIHEDEGGGYTDPWTYGDINVEPHGVYLLLQHVDFKDKQRLWPVTTSNYIAARHIIIRTGFTYEPSTGIAHHPTDSKLSFKVKYKAGEWGEEKGKGMGSNLSRLSENAVGK